MPWRWRDISQVSTCVRFKSSSLRFFGTWIMNIFSKIICEYLRVRNNRAGNFLHWPWHDLGPESYKSPPFTASNLSILGCRDCGVSVEHRKNQLRSWRLTAIWALYDRPFVTSKRRVRWSLLGIFFILFVLRPSTTIVSVPLKIFSFLIMPRYSVTGINYRLNSNKWSSGWPIGYGSTNDYNEAGRKFTWTSNPVLSVIAY